jgi:aspartyl-tRNA(Asn)/glutamyl-tRNA(Gln) amidotransferase subunit C
MKISLDEARRVAALASLEFGEPELERIAGEMSKILDYVDQLESVDVSEVRDEPGPSGETIRDDVTRAFRVGDEVASNAPSMLRGHFVVPKVIGGD